MTMAALQPHCRNCGAVLVNEQQRCAYCGSAQYFELTRIVRYVVQSREIRRKVFYPAVMLLGALSFLVIYLFFFEKISETNLIRIAPFWVFTFLFGYFGYTAEQFLQDFYFRKAGTVRAAFVEWHWKHFPLSIIYLPVPILDLRNPLSHAVWGSLVYALLFRAFFVFLWRLL